MNEREALKLALEYLEASDNYLGSLDHSKPIAVIKEVLTKPESKPVAWVENGKLVMINATAVTNDLLGLYIKD